MHARTFLQRAYTSLHYTKCLHIFFLSQLSTPQSKTNNLIKLTRHSKAHFSWIKFCFENFQKIQVNLFIYIYIRFNDDNLSKFNRKKEKRRRQLIKGEDMEKCWNELIKLKMCSAFESTYICCWKPKKEAYNKWESDRIREGLTLPKVVVVVVCLVMVVVVTLLTFYIERVQK